MNRTWAIVNRNRSTYAVIDTLYANGTIDEVQAWLARVWGVKLYIESGELVDLRDANDPNPKSFWHGYSIMVYDAKND